jgi:cyclohexadieny/prephenate dehydrogenase
MMADQEKSTCSSSDKARTDTAQDAGSPGQIQLSNIRKEIDHVDETISSLISVRLDLVRKIADIKRDLGLPTLDGDREKKVLEHVLGNASDSASAHAISTIYEALLRLSKEYQRDRRTDVVEGDSEATVNSAVNSQDRASALLYFPSVAILGLGAIGGSMAALIKKHLPQTKITGSDLCADSGRLAKEQGVVDDLANDNVSCLKDASLIVLAASPEANTKLLKQIAPSLKSGQVVIDVTSTKSAICSLAEEIEMGGAEFVGGHPFFGTERSGYGAAMQIRPENRIFCLVPTKKSSQLVVGKLTKWLVALNLRAEILDATFHDLLVARASHLPQLLSSLLGSQLQRNLDHEQLGRLSLATFTTFQSLKRLMKSPAPMWKEIIGQNKKEVAQALTEFQEGLDELLVALKEDDLSVIDQLFSEAEQTANTIEGNLT